MATIGLDSLFYAPITEAADGSETYGTPVKLAKAMTAELSIEVNEATLYADDAAAEVVKEFKNGTLSLGVDDIGAASASALTGAQIDDNGVVVSANATAVQDQTAYKKRQDELVAKYNAAAKRIDVLKAEKEARKHQRTVLTAFVDTMEQQRGSLTEFSESLWSAVVEKATVYNDGRIIFTLMNGTEIE